MIVFILEAVEANRIISIKIFTVAVVEISIYSRRLDHETPKAKLKAECGEN